MASKTNLASDQRFSQVTKDPRFWEMPERDKKIKIDKRFRAMFHDKKFNLQYTVDKRGRPINHNTTEDLKRFYDLSDSDDEESEDRRPSSSKTVKQKGKTKTNKDLESEPLKTKAKELKAKNGKLKATQESNRDEGEQKLKGKEKAGLTQSKQKNTHIPLKDTKYTSTQSNKIVPQRESDTEESGLEDESEESESQSDSEDFEGQVLGSDAESEDAESNDESEEESGEDEEGSQEEDDEEDESDSGPDLARGKGNIESSSEDEDDDDSNELLQKEPEIEHDWRELDKDAPRGDEVTNRLAVCNMDWDRLKAKDLLALFNSFKPKGGIIFSVKIYPSEYGKERLKEEELHGPQELKKVSEDTSDEQGIFKEKLREYQFKRLKYYYAVVECDTPETANKIYEECDGLEFESSCSFVDLRFIPNDVKFADEPKDSAIDVDLSAYKPKLFTSSAVATSKVEITWDETDHDRITTLNRPFKKNEILDMDFQAYLASSSEEEEDSDPDMASCSENEDTKSKKSSKDDEEQIARYRELLKSINNKEKKNEDNDMDMEIKWVPGLKESAEQMVKSKLDGKDNLTPWEKYLQKKKDKRKIKKKDKDKKQHPEEEEDAKEDDDDDDEIPSDVDLNDPYFSEELRKPGLKAKSSSGKKDNQSSEDEAEKEKEKAQIALLMMDDVEDDRKHFNYDKIVEQQNLSKRKKKQLKKKEELVEDEFQINVEDSRFQAMYTSHLYSIDPSDPSFKKTKAMGRVLEEKARRREKEQESRTEAVKRHAAELEAHQKKGTDPALSMLLKSVKNKTQQFQASKKPRIK